MDPHTRRRLVRFCGRAVCGHCGPRLALSTVQALVLAAPHSSAVLTLPPDEVKALQGRGLFRAFCGAVNDLAAHVRRAGLRWEFAWVLELSPSLGPNVHLLQHGSVVTRGRFLGAAFAAGLGWCDIRPIRHLPRLARYVLKLPLTPLDLGAARADRYMELHLALNGGRILGASRGFWRDASGRPLPGVRVARRAARTKTGGPGPPLDQTRHWRNGWQVPDPGDALGKLWGAGGQSFARGVGAGPRGEGSLH